MATGARLRPCALVIALLFLSGSTVDAQTERKALVIDPYGMIGVLWPVSERWTLRPELGVLASRSSTSSGVFPESDDWSATFLLRLAALQRVSHDATTRSYIVYGLETFLRTPRLFDQANWEGIVAYGMHEQLSDRVGLFGEVGGEVGYSTLRFPSIGSPGTSTTTWQLRAAGRLGVTLRSATAR